LDIPALRLAIRLSGIEGLALTKLDVLAGLDAVKICVAYQDGSRRLEEMPLDLDDLARVKPIWENQPGWPELQTPVSGATLSEASLPQGARKFIDRVSELVGIPIWVSSVGPARSETIIRHNPFNTL
jgi:adenylosuccinate synthase